MADSGTGTSNKQLELVYVRMLCDGEPVNKFLTIIELSNGTADGVIESFERAMGKVGVNDWTNALVSLGSDGASVYLYCSQLGSWLSLMDSKRIIFFLP